MKEPLTLTELKDLVRLLRRLEAEGKGWPVARTARELHVSKDYLYDLLDQGCYLERLPGPRPIRISARSVLKYLEGTYHGAGYFDAFAKD